MARFNSIVGLVCAAAVAPALGGCAAAIIGGMAGAGGIGYQAAQERGLNGAYDDAKMKAEIATQLGVQYGDITTTVYWGRVLLTGTSQSPQQKAQAEQIASAQPGVRAVYNEIVVGPPESAWEMTQDAMISTRVRSDLVFDADVRSGNYTIETERGSVYLIGSARSQPELDRATQLARYVPGVQRVVSYVEVRYGQPGPTMPPGPSQAVAPPGSYLDGPSSAPPGPASSSAPIQVQKLP
jgi:osmotically-inducible protein OsmY